MANPIDNSDDLIDSRDVIARIEELTSEREIYGEDYTGTGDAADAWADENPYEADELKALEALAEEGERYASDWGYGATLIRDSYFEQYAEQLADDVGDIDSNAGWPLNHIDWKAAAQELQQDYTEIEFDGVTYWVR